MGVLDALLSLLDEKDEDVTHIAVAFDNPIESWRNDRFEGYKDGSGVDPAILAQFDLVERAVATLGVTVWSMDEYEADDAIGAAAVQWVDKVDQVRILSPDKDFGQVVSGTQVVQIDRMRQREFDADGVKERLGVPPELVTDYLALVGDTADGIPGLKGFGAKSAAALLCAYGPLEELPRSPLVDTGVRGWKGLAATLDAGFDDALLYRELATLVTDIDLGAFEDTRWTGVRRDDFLAMCDELGVEGLRERPSTWAD